MQQVMYQWPRLSHKNSLTQAEAKTLTGYLNFGQGFQPCFCGKSKVEIKAILEQFQQENKERKDRGASSLSTMRKIKHPSLSLSLLSLSLFFVCFFLFTINFFCLFCHVRLLRTSSKHTNYVVVVVVVDTRTTVVRRVIAVSWEKVNTVSLNGNKNVFQKCDTRRCSLQNGCRATKWVRNMTRQVRELAIVKSHDFKQRPDQSTNRKNSFKSCAFTLQANFLFTIA